MFVNGFQISVFDFIFSEAYSVTSFGKYKQLLCMATRVIYDFGMS